MKQGVPMHLSLATAVLAVLLLPLTAVAGNAASVYFEAPYDPPAAFRSVDDPLARSPAGRVQIGPYVSVQVNVDGDGRNILGDAANGPSIAVNGTNPDNIIIGWRQFDSLNSGFRQAGHAYSFDGGQSWTFPGVLTPGVVRSQPVLGTTSTGNVLFQSRGPLDREGRGPVAQGRLNAGFLVDVFTSTDGGVTFGPPVSSFGGDKPWLAIDVTGGIGDGHVYGVWQRFFSCCGKNILTRSIDGGQSFQVPVEVALSPLYGTMTVAPDGTLLVSGVEGTQFADFSQFVVSRSTNARNPAESPTFTGVRVEMGGSMQMQLGRGPNPDGLLGQANVFVDRSDGPSRGTVYLLASVKPPGEDPLDVHIVHSEDGGATWSAPVRVNDDAGNHYQWLAAADVALDGRIDAIWADTRNSGQANVSELFYAWSYDGGRTWSGNEPITPAFDSFVGWPNQAKIGDYFTVVSERVDSSAAYAATFNGEQDIYYVRLFPDCNDNGRSDVTDIDTGDSQDADGSGVPDECETGGPMLAAPVPGEASVPNDFAVSGVGVGALVVFYIGGASGSSPVNGCPGLTLDLAFAQPFGFLLANNSGEGVLTRTMPTRLAGHTRGFQAVDRSVCQATNQVTFTFPP
jgi:hypothetical protein